MLQFERIVTNPLTPKIKNSYTDLHKLFEADTFFIYEGKSKPTQELHTVRILNPNCERVQADYDAHATLFIKEMIRIASQSPKALEIIIESFEISEQKIAYATVPYNSLAGEAKLILRDINLEKDIVKMMRDLIPDIELFGKLGLESLYSNLIGFDNIYRFREDNTFFLGGWTEGLSSDPSVSQSVMPGQEKPDDIYSLGLISLELLGLKSSDLLKILLIEDFFVHDAVVKGIITDVTNISPIMKKLIGMMMTKTHTKRMSWQQLKAELENYWMTNFPEELNSNQEDSASNISMTKNIAFKIKYDTSLFEITVPVNYSIQDVINRVRALRRIPEHVIVHLAQEHSLRVLETTESLAKLGLYDQQVLELRTKIQITLKFFDIRVAVSTYTNKVLKAVADEFKETRRFDPSIEVEVYRYNESVPLNQELTLHHLGITDGTTLEICFI